MKLKVTVLTWIKSEFGFSFIHVCTDVPIVMEPD